MDAHLVEIPGLGTLTARGLTGGDLEVLGGQADGALDGQVLALGALDQLGADLLEGLDLAGGQGDADLVGLLYNDNKNIGMLAKICSLLLRLWNSPRALVGAAQHWDWVERTGASKSPPFSGFW